MRAAYFDKYNKNNTDLKIGSFDLPKVGPENVLVKVSYAAVNPVDIMIKHGDLKLVTPYKTPQIAGNEVVGIIDKVGDKVTKFRIGDRVYGRLPIKNLGGFAEYVSVPAKDLAKVPSYLTDEEAAAQPLAALTITQALDLMKPEPGSTIFISGGTGSLGQIAIPIAKARGLKVITNGNGKNKENVLKAGADQFIDYKTEDYADVLKDIDYVLDTLGGDETEKQFKILKPGGHLVSLKGTPNGAFAERMNLPFWKKILFKIAGLKLDNIAKKKDATYDFVFVEPNGKQLEEASKILEANNVHPQIDKVYTLDQVNEAMDKVAHGHAKGKTLIKLH